MFKWIENKIIIKKKKKKAYTGRDIEKSKKGRIYNIILYF